MGDTFPNHDKDSRHRNPTLFYIGTSDPLGIEFVASFTEMTRSSIMYLALLDNRHDL